MADYNNSKCIKRGADISSKVRFEGGFSGGTVPSTSSRAVITTEVEWKFLVHKGSNEIGGNCIQVTSGKTTILLDVGLPLNAASPRVDVSQLEVDAVLGQSSPSRPLRLTGLKSAREHSRLILDGSGRTSLMRRTFF